MEFATRSKIKSIEIKYEVPISEISIMDGIRTSVLLIIKPIGYFANASVMLVASALVQ
jgi:hypothetical protein